MEKCNCGKKAKHKIRYKKNIYKMCDHCYNLAEDIVTRINQSINN